jgi:hypothetical protein
MHLVSGRFAPSRFTPMLSDVKVVSPPKTYWIFDKAFLAKYINSNAKTRVKIKTYSLMHARFKLVKAKGDRITGANLGVVKSVAQLK